MKNWILNNFLMKILSLLLAVMTWFYVNEELNREKKFSTTLYKSSFVEYMQSHPNLMEEIDKESTGK